jgi:hypothetical protein
MRVAFGALAAMIAVSIVPASVVAQAPTPGPLTTAQSLRCSFPTSATTGWREGAPQTITGEQTFGFQIDAINAQKRTARIVGSSGSAEASAFLTGTSLNVIEQTPIGNFILTSVFTAGGSDNKLIAVHSRHVGDLAAAPSVSQHYGTCEVVK